MPLIDVDPRIFDPANAEEAVDDAIAVLAGVGLEVDSGDREAILAILTIAGPRQIEDLSDFLDNFSSVGALTVVAATVALRNAEGGGTIPSEAPVVQMAYTFDLAPLIEDFSGPHPYATPEFRVAIFSDTSDTLEPGIYQGQTTDAEDPKPLRRISGLPTGIIVASIAMLDGDDLFEPGNWLKGPIVYAATPQVADSPDNSLRAVQTSDPEPVSWYYVARPATTTAADVEYDNEDDNGPAGLVESNLQAAVRAISDTIGRPDNGTDGTFVLMATIVEGVVSYSWEPAPDVP